MNYLAKRCSPLLFSCLLMSAVSFSVKAPAIAPDSTIHPLIGADGVLLGASQNGKWIPQEKAAKLLSGKETYQVYSAASPLGAARGGKPKSMDAPCPDQMLVETTLPPGAVIGVGGSWNALPRHSRMESAQQPVYIAAVKSVLTAHGVRNPEVHIDQILRCDLDNDRTDEVLITAHRYIDLDHGIQTMPAGGYSVIIMRKLVHGHVQTSLVTGDFYPKSKAQSAPLIYQIAGVYDLMGNGKMQILVGWRYYEGSGNDIYALSGDRAKLVLSSGCGA